MKVPVIKVNGRIVGTNSHDCLYIKNNAMHPETKTVNLKLVLKQYIAMYAFRAHSGHNHVPSVGIRR